MTTGPAKTLFLTGGSGFLGSRLLTALHRRATPVTVLDRSGSVARRFATSSLIRTVSADLLETEAYGNELARADMVLHLAAATGRASEKEHFRVNLQGTECLIRECQRSGIRRLLYVSSIAAKFPNNAHYHYARAKAQAEVAVRSSGLDFAIIRPTMILGPGSPILTALERLGRPFFFPVFGDGKTVVQPIHVDDVVECLLTVLDRDMFSNEIFEVGGLDRLSIEELLHTIRQVRRGVKGRSVHVPLSLLMPILTAAESMGLGPLLPLSVGQLASFRHDSTIEANPLYETGRTRFRNLPRTLESSFVV